MSQSNPIAVLSAALDNYLTCPRAVIVNGNRVELRSPSMKETHDILAAMQSINAMIEQAQRTDADV